MKSGSIVDNNALTLLWGKSFLADTLEIMFVKDRDLVYLAASNAFAEMVDLDSTAKVVGKTDFDFFDPALAQHYVDDDRRMMESGEPLAAYVEPLPDMDGKPRWSRTRKSLIRGENGEILGVYGVCVDITETVELKSSKSLLDSIPAAAFRCKYSVESELLMANDGFYRLCGYTKEEFAQLCKNRIAELLYPPDQSAFGAALAPQSQEDGAVIQAEIRIVRKDGSLCWVEVRGTPGEEANGEKTIFCLMTDITIHKEAEAQLALRDEALRYADNSLSAGTVINGLGLNTPLIYVSDNMEKLIGYTKAEFHQMYRGQYRDLIHPDDFERVLRDNTQYSEERPKHFEMQFRFVRKDGSIVWVWEKSDLLESFRGRPAYLTMFIDITPQKQVEQALNERSAMAQVLLDHSGLSLWEYEPDKNRIRQLMQGNNSHHKDLKLMDNFPYCLIEQHYIKPSSVLDQLNLLQKIKDGAATATADIWFAPDGKDEWCERITYVSTFDSDGKVVKSYATNQDITAEKLAEQRFEEELQRSQSMHSEKLLTNVRANLTKKRIESYFADEKLSVSCDGMPYDQAIKALAAVAYTSQERTLIRNKLSAKHIVAEYEQGVREYALDYRRKIRDGRVLWAHTIVKTYQDVHTGDVKSFMYTTDINDEMLLKEMLDRISEMYYDFVGEIDLEHDRFTLYYSRKSMLSMLQTTSMTYESAIDENVRNYVIDEDAEMFRQSMSIQNIIDKLEKSDSYSFVGRDRLPDGRICSKQISFFYLDRQTHHVVIIQTDITEVIGEQQRAQELLKSALEQAKQASSAKTDFLSKMSHEIRTPMNAIIGMNALAAQCIGDPEAAGDCIAKVGISARYLLSLINDILDMSRIESGKLSVQNKKIPTEEFLRDVNTIIYEQAQTKGLSYDSIVTGYLADSYIGDAMKLQQVLVNLLGNAVKFTPKGGKVQLIVSQERVEKDKAFVRFVVNDTGCGISEEFQKKMFEPFEQEHTGTTTAYGGTGLGLAITKNLVQLMGGSVLVSSIVGVGTEFVTTVPLGVTDAPLQVHSTVALNRLSALIVDDELLICEQTERILREIGMKTEWVTGGYQAIERVKTRWMDQKSYDIILVDWKMPELDGIETARQIRKIVGPEVTIVIITAYEWAGIEKEAKEAGVNLLITKPLFKSSLISTFEHLFSEKSQEAAPPQHMEYDFTGKRVLLVEDHLLNVEVAKRLLQIKGMEVEVAENGLMAIESFSRVPVGYFDAILMDIRMPVMDGLTAAKSIRQLKKKSAKTIPIIAMSANAFDEDMEKSREAGMNAHLSKPIEPMLLYEALAKYIPKG